MILANGRTALEILMHVQCGGSARQGRTFMQFTIWAWVLFNAFVLAMLTVDLGVFNRRVHVIHAREALAWSTVWIALALGFNAILYVYAGNEIGHEFLAGYLIEKSLSVDNIFVFVLVFSYFKVPPKYQHRILFWGILGALIFRGIMIGAGAVLLQRFHAIIYVFGAFLIFTGFRMAFHRPDDLDPGANPVVRFGRKFLPITKRESGKSFLVRENGRWMFTPLFIVLLVVETTDIVFALDSIPAIFAVTERPFIVYTSNIFAILGLRSLYFLLAGVIGLFCYLKFGLSAVLVFVGVKMLLSGTEYKIPTFWALTAVAAILSVSVVASLVATRCRRQLVGRRG